MGADWELFVQELDDLLDDRDFRWAESTIGGIRETVETQKLVTERQRTAIDNIRDAVERRRRR